MEIRPFRGWRYHSEKGDIGTLIAPPYDVISQQQRDELLARSDKNIVAVDLPHFPPAKAGPQSEYQQAARLLGQWQASSTLRQDDNPCLYAYEQEYSWAGKSYSRRALICGVRATELGKDVIPHEHTFAGPKADRLELMKHTCVQLSPLFGFCDDPGGEATDALWSAANGVPDAWGRLNGVNEKLWTIDDPKVINTVAAALRGVPVFIADGHHRYTTAMDYRDHLQATGGIGVDHEANFVMFALVSRDDPGLLVLPTHRIIRGLKAPFTVEKLAKAAPQFAWRRCSLDDADLSNSGAFLHRYGPGSIAMLDEQLAEVWIARLTDPRAMEAAAPDEIDAWRGLDTAILHKLIIDDALAPWRTDDVFIEYTPDARAVVQACRSGRAQLGVCLQGTPLDAVVAVATAGASMPHKSTYFYPKLATGMVLKPLG